MKIQWFGHSTFALGDGKTTVLVDPWFEGNPTTKVKAHDVQADVIVLTHGHEDHYGDTLAIAKRTGATVVALTEIANELTGDGLESVTGPNFGGIVSFDWGWTKFVPAIHSSTTPKGTVTPPAGALIHIGGCTVYHLGDTALFSDLALPGRRHPIDVALVPIGGFYTMDRVDAVSAVELVKPRVVIPCHYGTFPLLHADAEAFKRDVEAALPGTQTIILSADGDCSFEPMV